MARTWDGSTSNFMSLGDIANARFPWDSDWTYLSFFLDDTGTGDPVPISKMAAAGTELQFAVRFEVDFGASGRLTTWMDDFATEVLQNAVGVSANTWYFYVATNASSTVTHYLFEMDGTKLTDDRNASVIANTSDLTNPVRIGIQGDDANAWSGEIAHCCYVDAALSEAEMKEFLWNPPGAAAKFLGAYGVQFYLPIGWSSPDVDLSGKGNDGTITGTLAVGPNPPTQDSYGFSGVSMIGGAGGGGGGSSMLLQLLTQSGEGAFL